MTAASISISFEAGASISTPTTLPGADQIKTYGLDGLGNWKTSNFTVVNSDESTTSTAEVRQHNYVNEITSVRDTTGGTPTTTPFTYDKNGNLLNDGVRIYQYDAFNRLYNVSNSSNTLLATYQYDVLNRRVVKTIADLGGGNGGLTGDIPAGTTVYLYDGRQIVEEGNLSDGYIWTQAYFWGQYVDELMFFAIATETPTTYRLLSDLLYRSVALVTTSNAVTEAYDCDAYGNTLLYSGPGTDDLWFTDDDVTTNNPINTTIFTGRQYDPESQIYYYRARYYSPNIGRFLSRDPLSGAEFSQGTNLYAYCENNFLNENDPTGQSGTLTIYCDNGGGSLTDGHSWVSYTDDQTGVTTTYGTWGNNPDGLGNGLHTDLEQGRTGDESLSTHLDDDQESKLYNDIDNTQNAGADGWGYTHPCSSFSSDTWNDVTGDKLNDRNWFGISNPNTLGDSIKKNKNAKTDTGGGGGCSSNKSSTSASANSSS